MKLKKQSGQVLVGVAIAMVVLAGFAGLAIDMGTLRYQRRLQQTAADSAAVAGAQNLQFGSGWVAGGLAASSQNGFADNNSGAGCVGGSVGCISVAINNGPLAGPHAGDLKYVEAIVSTVQPTYFMKVFGVTSKPVLTRAVATNVSGGSNTNCLYTLGPPTNSITGIDAQGSAILNAPNCGIADNGNLDTTGNNYKVIGNSISVSGQCLGSHCGPPDVVCTASAPGTCPPLHDAPASQDPMKGLAAPSQPAASPDCPGTPCDYVAGKNGTYTIHPGTYSSITLKGGATVTMLPGIYYFNGPVGGGSVTPGGITMEGGSSLTDMSNPGVMLYFTNGSTMQKFVGGGSIPDVNLTPMTTAENSTYAGILMFQDPADTQPAYLGGDDNSTFYGTIYMPTSTVTFFGNNHVTFDGTVITYSVDVQGNPTVNFGVAPSGVPVPAKLTQPILVE
jgi:hypothetical protein